VFVGKFTRCDRVPKHRREDRLEGGKIAHRLPIITSRLIYASRVGISPSSSSGVMCSQSAASHQ
jgi:hypothetical protein